MSPEAFIVISDPLMLILPSFFMMISEEDLPEGKKEIFKDFEPLLKNFISEVFD